MPTVDDPRVLVDIATRDDAAVKWIMRWPRFWAASILALMMMPAHVLIIPLFVEMQAFGWIDTYAALIVPFLVNPIAVFIMRQYIASLPSELEDAARVDGAGEFYIL